MKKSAPLLLAIPGLALFAVAALSARPSRSAPPITAAAASPALITDYRHWRCVTPKPVRVDKTFPELSVRCMGPTPEEIANGGNPARNPHLDNSPTASPKHTRYISVYVNPIGEDAMLYQPIPRFPVGSVVIKEKLAQPTGTTPELLTVMRKREKGYNPQSADWEYMVFDGTGKTIQSQGRLQNCQTCHSPNAYEDYIFRSYLTFDDQMRLYAQKTQPGKHLTESQMQKLYGDAYDAAAKRLPHPKPSAYIRSFAGASNISSHP